MQLNGIYHAVVVSAENVEFYTRVLGLRMVKKSEPADCNYC